MKIAKYRDVFLRRQVRVILMKIWPLSILIDRYYQAKFSTKNWQKINKHAQTLWLQNPPKLSLSQHSVINDLRDKGVHQTSINNFIIDNFDFEELNKDVNNLFLSNRIQKQIKKRCSYYAGKWYVIRAFGFKQQVNIPTSLVNLLLNEKIIDTVNGYLGLCSRLVYCDIWHNIPRYDDEPMLDSELWHRDHEDRRLFKLILYLSDVDQSNGPLEYVCGTQPGGDRERLYSDNPPNCSYVLEEDIRDKVSSRHFYKCIGNSGTLIFFDARGIHRGGRAISSARKVVVATYATDASIDNSTKYKLAEPERIHELSKPAKYAIRA